MDINKLKLTNNCIHICHYCLSYRTYRRNDIKKHYEKNKKCQLNYIPDKMITFEEAFQLSQNKRYYFNFDYSNFTIDDYAFLVTHYKDEFNLIEKEDFYEKKDIFKKKLLLKNLSETNLINELDELIQDNLEPDVILPVIKLNDFKKENENENNSLNENENNSLNVNELKEFQCPRCYKEYKSKRSLYNHLLNLKLCNVNKTIYEAKMNKNNELITNNQLSNTSQTNILNNGNIQNNNLNVQNNLSVQNNYNNNNYNNAPTIKLEVKDFGREAYTYNHIPKSYIKNDDFYLYSNFLNKLLENEKNQNIYFINHDENVKSENRKAIIYADETLYKINEDKAIFMILEKLKNTMEIILSKVYKNEEDKVKIAEIIKYYRVITGHFKHDTIFKDYDHDDKYFYNLTHKRRSRDVYTSKIKNIINTHGNPIKELTNNHNIQILDIFNPDIEDYASTRVRNKDLKKKKDELLF